MSLDCRRWIELADREATGEALPTEEQAFQRLHAASCAECAREAAIWRALEAPAANLAPQAEELERIMALATAERARRSVIALPRRWKNMTLAGVALASAAALVLWWNGEHARSGSHRLAKGTATATIAAAQIRIPAANSPSPAEPVESGAPPHCSEVIPGATVCFARGAEIASRALEGPDRALEVARGRAVVSLLPQPPGTSFSLTTALGKVTAVGTIFSVEVRADGATIARVIEGHVLVRAGETDIAHSVVAGHAFRLGEQQPTLLSDHERDQDLALLSLSGAVEHDPSNPSSAPKVGDLGGAPVAPPDMLGYARSLRASGDFRRAADVYRRIHAANPQSPTGRAALVSLGELLLSLNDAQGALSAFDSYLVGGGALDQEALFGRARALRTLKRPAEERAAIDRFLAAYPSSPQSRVLRSRLAAMKK
jgi:ferric-dicitrate binding protein FerR (iron transport regulator)